MPKESRDHSSKSSRSSPYPCSSTRATCTLSKISSESTENVKEWEEARCSVCMEHPHNAVLLQCSSYDKGCRPYMCNTSYRHSNCLDQFCKSFAESPTNPTEEATPSNLPNISELGTVSRQNLACGSQKHTKLICPLCRGEISGWIVVEAARDFMDAKTRSCACETCEYIGTYSDLRKHARLVHPLVRPSEANPERQRHWTRLEQERDLGDVLSTIQSTFGDERAIGDNPFASSGFLSVLIFFSVSGAPLFDRRASPSRSRRQLRSRSRTSTTQLWGEDMDDMEAGSNAREDDSGSSESSLAAQRHNRRRRMPNYDDEL